MQPGSFYCFVPKKGAISAWLPFCKQTQRGLYRRLNALLKQYVFHPLSREQTRSNSRGGLLTEEGAVLDDSDLFHCSQFHQATRTQASVFPGAAVCVRQSSNEHHRRKEPNVYSTDSAVIVFYGYISNLDDLCSRMGRHGPPYRANGSRRSADLAGGLDMTMGEITARVILHLYLKEQAKDPLLLLSDLQGQYAFVIYDSDDKHVFAARDTSGKESLYFRTEQEKGGVILSNEPGFIADLEQEEGAGSQWYEVPPGYYLYGRNPQLQQYALTPDQLTCHWSLDLDSEVDLHFSSEDSLESRSSWNASLREPILGRSHSIHESALYPQQTS